jgi:uncharacterized protein YeeX (DUF496 family)
MVHSQSAKGIKQPQRIFFYDEYGNRKEVSKNKKRFEYLDNINKTISTISGEAEYVGTEFEDDYGDWHDDYSVKDGYYVIHGDNRHHVYKLKRNVVI